jgi:hypothetical protein
VSQGSSWSGAVLEVPSRRQELRHRVGGWDNKDLEDGSVDVSTDVMDKDEGHDCHNSMVSLDKIKIVLLNTKHFAERRRPEDEYMSTRSEESFWKRVGGVESVT